MRLTTRCLVVLTGEVNLWQSSYFELFFPQRHRHRGQWQSRVNSHVTVSESTCLLDYIDQGSTTRGPRAEPVISGSRSRLNIQETSHE